LKATTHTEVYRRHTGELVPRALQFLPLARAGIRTAAKKKLVLVLLLLPPAIATVIFSFVVYAGFAIQAGAPPSALVGPEAAPSNVIGQAMMAGAAKQLIQAREQIVAFHVATNVFALLLMAWYGAGLFAEDKRLGAHLLYFARPLTRFDYVVSKFLVVTFFGMWGALVPGLVICTVATFASPEWSFFTQEFDVIVATLVMGVLVTALTSSFVLAVSTLATRKTFALVGTFGWFMLTLAIAGMLMSLRMHSDWGNVSIFVACGRIGSWLFDIKENFGKWSVGLSWASVAFTFVVCWTVIWFRVKRMEVVA
jgi:hypothetical protein